MRSGVIRFARRFAERRFAKRHLVKRRLAKRNLTKRLGFSLIEALAAFTILTAVLGQLLSGVSGAARNESRADFLQRAARQGKSQLESLGADGAMPVGVTQGRYDDGLLWRLVVAQGDVVRGQPGAPTTTSYSVDLAIQRPNGEGSLNFSTVKIISTGGQQPGFGALGQ